MEPAIYILGTLVCLGCALLLLRSYFVVRKRLLFWCGLCFAGLTISSFLVFVDLILLPTVDLFVLRLCVSAIAMFLMLYGLIWESE